MLVGGQDLWATGYSQWQRERDPAVSHRSSHIGHGIPGEGHGTGRWGGGGAYG